MDTVRWVGEDKVKASISLGEYAIQRLNRDGSVSALDYIELGAKMRDSVRLGEDGLEAWRRGWI